MIKTNMSQMVPRRDAFKRVIRLLSGGVANRKAFPGGDITIFPWDSRIDEWLTQQARQQSPGSALTELVSRVADLNGCPLDDFLLGDVNTVLLVSRALRYNSEVSYQSSCPSCKRQDTETIRVPDELVKINEKPNDYPGWDMVTLPDCKDVIKLRLLNVKDEKSILAREDTDRVKVPDRIARIIRSIMSVNDSVWDEPSELVTYYDCLSPKDATYIEEAIEAKEPRLDTTVWHQCKGCGTKFKHELVIDQPFFR